MRNRSACSKNLIAFISVTKKSVWQMTTYRGLRLQTNKSFDWIVYRFAEYYWSLIGRCHREGYLSNLAVPTKPQRVNQKQLRLWYSEKNIIIWVESDFFVALNCSKKLAGCWKSGKRIKTLLHHKRTAEATSIPGFALFFFFFREEDRLLWDLGNLVLSTELITWIG